MVYLFLFAAETCFTVLFIKAGYPQSTKKGFFFKMCASVIFVLTGLYNFIHSPGDSYARLIMCALVSGLAGDVFLTFDPFIKDKSDKKKSAFFVLLGGAFFLTGHILYMAAFIKEIRKTGAFSAPLFFASLAAVLMLLALAAAVSRLRPGKALLPVSVYAAAISAMFALALCLAVRGEPRSAFHAPLLIAAPLLFIVSDSSLMFKTFDKERFDTLAVRSVNLGTYFLAQMLFAMTILG